MQEPKPVLPEKPRTTFTRKEQIALLVKKSPAIQVMIDKFGLQVTL